MIPFNCRFVDQPALPNERPMNRKFKDEVINDANAMAAFFKWLIEGARRMYGEQLQFPKCVADSINDYKTEQDIYFRFVEMRLEVNKNPNCDWETPASEFYNEFKDWCREDEGVTPTTQRVFGASQYAKDFWRATKKLSLR